MESIMFFKLLLALPLLHWCVMGKECTNIPTKLSSHTFRFDLLSSNNDTLKQEMFSHYHLTPTDDSAWASLLPRKVLKEEDELDWLMLYRKMKNLGGDKIAKGFLNEVSLHDVKLEPGSIHWQAQQTNLEYLLMLNVDSLVWSFRKNAGLQAPGKPYGGWEAPDGELRGHFVGHYLSATAQMWASTRNTSLKANMDRVVRALATCQDKIGTGYLSAFPSEQFDRFEAIQPVWAPYYTIHKIMAGLLDQYIFANDNGALRMTERMADYFYKRVKNMISKHTIERHSLSINEETGGMNDILYRLYNIKGNMKHLWLAHLFDKPCFLGELALKQEAHQIFTLKFRIPFWARSKGLKAVLNGHRLSLPASGNFLTVTRKWSTGDKLTLELPLSLRTESIQDDRPGFDSLQAILYGPYLLVGLTNDDWDLQAESDSLSDWISPIPSSHNSHLISLTQEHGHITFALFNSNNSIKMDKLPEPGTNSSVHATFRLIMEGSKLSEHSGLKGDIGRAVMLEPFDLPGMFVVHEGRGGSLRVTDFSREKNSVFSLAAGLNGKDDTVSLESEKHKGCFVHSENKHQLGVGIKLKCNAELSDDRFKEAASFRIRDGVSTYGPISFVAKGVRRNFVLAPLYSLRDEYYTVYFKIHP